MITAYYSGEICFDQNLDNTDVFLEFSKLYDGIFFTLAMKGSRTNIISFFCIGEDNNLSKAQKIAERRFKKLFEFLKVSMPNRIQIRTTPHIGHYDSSSPGHNKFSSLLNNITQSEFENYLNDSSFSKNALLLEGLEDYEHKKIFDAFPKLVNYCDDKPAGNKFRSLRDCLSHKEVQGARPIVENAFPNEFEFNGDEFLREESEKNRKGLERYWPEILLEAQNKFFEMVKNS